MQTGLVCGALSVVLLVAGCGGSSASSPAAAGSSSTAGDQSTGGATGSAMGGASTGGALPTAGSSAVAGSSAAGSSSMMTGGTFTSSVPGSQVVGNLSNADAQTLCRDLANSDAFKSITDGSCRATAVLSALLAPTQTDAGVQAACQSNYSSCVASPMPTMCDTKPSAACTATVSEFEACINDETLLFKTLGSQIPMCSELKVATLLASSAPLGTVASPESCATLNQKCPELAPEMM